LVSPYCFQGSKHKQGSLASAVVSTQDNIFAGSQHFQEIQLLLSPEENAPGVGGEEGPQAGATSIKFSDLKGKPLGHTWSILFWTQQQLNLLEMLRTGKNVVLCGDYGTGKTSLLVFAALEAVRRDQTAKSSSSQPMYLMRLLISFLMRQ
jgi:predicted ribonuclease YlaK